jgi:hypothetical protein
MQTGRRPRVGPAPPGKWVYQPVRSGTVLQLVYCGAFDGSVRAAGTV